jgi:two-component system OmpR family sensor kinase
VHESQQRLIVIEALVAAAALLFAGVVGWFLVRVGLRPLRSVEQTALLIADGGDLEHTLPGDDRPTEIGRLSAALNTMLGTIRRAFSERDATEAALRDSEERMRRFVADVSHELRTPLAAVSAYTELFDRGARDRPEDLARAMHGINVEAGRMHELVEELLLLARLDEGRPLASKPLDLNEVVVDAIAAARTVAPDRKITLRVHDVVMVSGDAGRLRQVFDNLLANVRTHTPPETVTAIELRTDGPHAVVTFRDNGPGMTTEQAHRVFERFFRADSSRSRSSGGSGLGLAIVNSIITAHGGSVRVETAPGEGFGVVITLPLLAGTTEPIGDE